MKPSRARNPLQFSRFWWARRRFPALSLLISCGLRGRRAVTAYQSMQEGPENAARLFSLLTGGIGAAIAGGLVLSPEIAVIAIIAAGIVLAGMRALAMRQVGGQTGDVCGAVQVLTELAMLTVYAATID